MGGTSTSNGSMISFLQRFLFGALLVGIVCLVVVGGTRREATALLSKESAEIVKQEHVMMIERDNQKGSVQKSAAELDFDYMSKRRVPNGPDPIHNRRAGNSGRPPGQA